MTSISWRVFLVLVLTSIHVSSDRETVRAGSKATLSCSVSCGPIRFSCQPQSPCNWLGLWTGFDWVGARPRRFGDKGFRTWAWQYFTWAKWHLLNHTLSRSSAFASSVSPDSVVSLVTLNSVKTRLAVPEQLTEDKDYLQVQSVFKNLTSKKSSKYWCLCCYF